MLTAILVDGSKNPVSIMVETEAPIIKFEGSPNRPAGGFNLVRKEKTVLIYRSGSRKLTDEVFEQQAALEVDKILDPDRYREIERAAKAKAQKAR